jgi:hypothetical protein
MLVIANLVLQKLNKLYNQLPIKGLQILITLQLIHL